MSRRFSVEPLGPVGALLDVKEKKWVLAVECCLRNLLFAFVCDNHSDTKTLRSILNRVFPEGTTKPTIITTKFLNHVHDVSRNHPSTNRYPTVLEMVKVSSPVVANCLIDQLGVESILLIESNSEARQFMKKPPPMCHRAYTLCGDQVYGGEVQRYYSSTQDKPKYLMISVEEHINSLKRDVDNLNNNLLRLEQQKREIRCETQKNHVAKQNTHSRMASISKDIAKVSTHVYELTNVTEAAPIDVSVLEEEVNTLRHRIEVLEGERIKLQEQVNACNEGFVEAKQMFAQVSELLKQKKEVADNQKAEVIQAESEKEKQTKILNYYKTKLEEQREVIGGRQAEFDAAERGTQETVQKASRICPNRIDVRRSVKNINIELAQLKTNIQDQKWTYSEKEELVQKHAEMKQKYHRIQQEMNSSENMIKRLDRIMNKRHCNFDLIRQFIIFRIQSVFEIILALRSYTGKVTFDHRKKTLDLVVHTNKASQGQTADLKQLSGGEKSLSTISFILSLWDVMETPFRCMDEFDVFMDLVNRRISTDLIFEVAKEQCNRQFIFFTPLTAPTQYSPSVVKIFRMPDPVRGQLTLPFERVTEEDNGEVT